MNPKQILDLLTSMAPATPLHMGVKKNCLGVDVSFEIRHGLDVRLANQCDIEWMGKNLEILTHVKDNASSEDELVEGVSKLHMEDAHWRWVSKAFGYFTSEYNWFYWVSSDGRVQGVCLIYHPKDSMVDGQGIFYIEYVAVAPWNRPNPLASVEFCGVGSDLIRFATNYAIGNLGLRPGFSLHSLPKAAGFYKKIGMVCIPAGKKDTLEYFEMTKESAEAFVGVANG